MQVRSSNQCRRLSLNLGGGGGASLRGAGRDGRRRRGLALIITLWVVVILTIMAYSMLFEADLNADLTRQHRERFYAMVLARSAIGRATVDLKNDLRHDAAETVARDIVDAKGDPWARRDDEYTDSDSDRRMKHGTFTVRVVDENRFYPLNFANQRALYKLLQVLGLEDEEEAEWTAAAIIDYIDDDQTPSLPEPEAELENRAYEKLIRDEYDLDRNDEVTYVNKDDYMMTRDELLQIYGVTPHLYYGSAWTGEEDPRLKRYRRPRYYDRMGVPRDYRPGLRDLVSTQAIGAMNLNTLRPEVAHALFSLSSESLTEGENAAKTLIQRRPESRTDRQPNNDGAFTSFSQLPEAGIDLTTANAARAGGALLGTSSTFRIQSVGISGNSSYYIEAVVTRDLDVIPRDDSKGPNARNRRRPARRGEDRASDSTESSETSSGSSSSRGRGRNADNLVQRPALRVVEWREGIGGGDRMLAFEKQDR